MKYKIYCLIDTVTNKPFYVGRTKQDLNKRLKQHLLTPHNIYLKLLFSNMKAFGVKPNISLIQTTDLLSEAIRLESEWTKHLKYLGFDVVNIHHNEKIDFINIFDVDAAKINISDYQKLTSKNKTLTYNYVAKLKRRCNLARIYNKNMTKRSKYPFATLEVGQEHFIQLGEEETIHEVRSRVSASAAIYSRGKDIKFSVRTQPDGVKLIRTK